MNNPNRYINLEVLMETQNEKLAQIRLLAMDFDGVHTDGFVYFGQNGEETVRCSRRDSLGLNMLKEVGIKLFIISKEENPVVVARSKKLQIECFSGVENSKGKKDILALLQEREGCLQSEVAFIGDDLNDLEAIEYAGIGVTVADGHPDVKRAADLVLSRNGGDHALRELCERILDAKGVLPSC